MDYQQKKISNELTNSVEKLGITKKRMSEMLGVARQTLDVYLKEGEMPLSTFIKICKLLQLEPSTFFLQNNGNLNSTINSKNVTQSIGETDLQKELLIQENKHLKEKIELLERLVNASKS